MKIVAFLKKNIKNNINTLLLCTILVFVVLIFRKKMREGASQGEVEEDRRPQSAPGAATITPPMQRPSMRGTVPESEMRGYPEEQFRAAAADGHECVNLGEKAFKGEGDDMTVNKAMFLEYKNKCRPNEDPDTGQMAAGTARTKWCKVIKKRLNAKPKLKGRQQSGYGYGLIKWGCPYD